jgi:UDP-GlcNAc:undecaprenyl-phosphate GlcNAc-1-phosphate transferase
MTALLSAGVALAAGLALALLWRALGIGDAPRGAEAERKLQRAPVPQVGGLALLAGWAALAPAGALPAFAGEPAVLLAGGLALGLGTLDDLRAGGLGPGPKLLLQLLAGGVLGAGAWLSGVTPMPAAALLALAAVGSMNALNTYDNADGAALGAGGLGLVAAGSPLAPATLALVVPNLLLRRRAAGEEGAAAAAGPGDPWLYLGDAGSHLLALAVLVSPGAAWALLLPGLDLGRVALLRLRRGLPPWRGDRRHLAHRLQRAGLGPVAVALSLLAVAAPACWRGDALGAGLTAGLFALACLATRRHAEPGPGLPPG